MHVLQIAELLEQQGKIFGNQKKEIFFSPNCNFLIRRNRNGTCLTTNECSGKGGQASGSCASG